MAQKRMFDKSITNNDNFVELPATAQNLYFHLSMNADDDGFIDNWKSIMRMVGSRTDDIKILIAKSYVIPFESGVIVIKHWRINNFLRKDRHVSTKYVDEMNSLELGNNEEYLLSDNSGQPLVNHWSTQNRKEENRKEKKRIEENREEEILCPAIQDCIPYSEIINYLNQITGAHYKSSSQKTKTCIHARWQEGFRLDDFKIVINKKYNEWVGTDMEKFLRPETLFGTKFEGYLNQADIKREITTKDVEKIIDWEEYLND